MEKQQILKHVKDLTSQELFDFIRREVVAFTELQSTGDFDSLKQKAVKDLLRSFEQSDDNAYNQCRIQQDYETYLNNYPKGRNADKATDALKVLHRNRLAEEIKRKELIDNIKRNKKCTPDIVRKAINDGIISELDLTRDCNIPEHFISSLYSYQEPSLSLGQTPNEIPNGYTEVYFWGIPGSGKTCALSGILYTASKIGWLQMAAGEGYDYMTCLKNIFNDGSGFLPSSTPSDKTQYLPFVLKKPSENKSRSVSLIELSGEIFNCFYRTIGSKKIEDQHRETFEIVNRFLKSSNRKIHFFFIDYSKNTDKDNDGYTQEDYLTAAALYFQNNDIFRNTTDAIYVVTTKSDMMSCPEAMRLAFAKEYLQERFPAFINALKYRCEKNSINGGRLTVEPFSLGNVYFQSICDFNRKSSVRIIEILMERIPSQRSSILDIFNK